MVQTNQAWRVEPFIMIEVSWISIISSPWFYIRKNTVQLIITGLDLVLPLQAWLDGPSCSLFFGTERQPGKFDGWHSVSLTPSVSSPKKSTLWQTFTSLWKITMFNGKTHYKSSFSIAMLNYHKVSQKSVGSIHHFFMICFAHVGFLISSPYVTDISQWSPCSNPLVFSPSPGPKGFGLLEGAWPGASRCEARHSARLSGGGFL